MLSFVFGGFVFSWIEICGTDRDFCNGYVVLPGKDQLVESADLCGGFWRSILLFICLCISNSCAYRHFGIIGEE